MVVAADAPKATADVKSLSQKLVNTYLDRPFPALSGKKLPPGVKPFLPPMYGFGIRTQVGRRMLEAYIHQLVGKGLDLALTTDPKSPLAAAHFRIEQVKSVVFNPFHSIEVTVRGRAFLKPLIAEASVAINTMTLQLRPRAGTLTYKYESHQETEAVYMVELAVSELDVDGVPPVLDKALAHTLTDAARDDKGRPKLNNLWAVMNRVVDRFGLRKEFEKELEKDPDFLSRDVMIEVESSAPNNKSLLMDVRQIELRIGTDNLTIFGRFPIKPFPGLKPK